VDWIGAAGRLARLTTSDVRHAGAQDAQGLTPLKVRMLLDFAASIANVDGLTPDELWSTRFTHTPSPSPEGDGARRHRNPFSPEGSINASGSR
jgi:hypothetical protein